MPSTGGVNSSKYIFQFTAKQFINFAFELNFHGGPTDSKSACFSQHTEA